MLSTGGFVAMWCLNGNEKQVHIAVDEANAIVLCAINNLRHNRSDQQNGRNAPFSQACLPGYK